MLPAILQVSPWERIYGVFMIYSLPSGESPLLLFYHIRVPAFDPLGPNPPLV